MSKHFIDCEFLEGPQKEKFPIYLFRKNTPNTIDLISIGIVSEDCDAFSKKIGKTDRTFPGREYYAISKDFNLKEAWNRYDLVQQSGDMRNLFPEGRKIYWLRENVLKPIWRELFFQAYDCSGLSNKQTEAFYQDVNSGKCDHYFTFKSFQALVNHYGKTNKEIAEEIVKFCNDEVFITEVNGELVGSSDAVKGNPEFYAYFADYDWVVFCWLFGKMMDLPDGFPMYCKDLKQDFDFYNGNFKKRKSIGALDKKWIDLNIDDYKEHPNYPKQENNHNALDDARWNKKLYEFLQEIK